jgi:hypothetical protein
VSGKRVFSFAGFRIGGKILNREKSGMLNESADRLASLFPLLGRERRGLIPVTGYHYT